MSSGVYAIVNEANGHLYVGSAVSFHMRHWRHWSSLRLGQHRNRHL